LDTKRIFVSWSGERSRSAALGLKSLLLDVLGESLDVFISAHMEPGVVWVQELGRELEGSDFGILCLTQDNIQSSWLLFEAGAIAKNFGAARVVPYLIDDLVLTGPLSQFQSVRADHQGTLRLLQSINGLRETPAQLDRLQRRFDKWWADLEQTLANLPAVAHPGADISDRSLLETIWQGVQSLLNSGAQLRSNVLALPRAETAHLLNLRDRPEMVYTGGDAVKKEMRMLRDLGLISNTQPIAGLPNEFTLKDRFALSETGRQYVETISPSSPKTT
jgi:TIR domain-containing protein